MRCHDCRKRTTSGDSAIRGRNVPSRRYRVGYTEFRRIRVCRACLGPRGWAHAVEQGAVKS